MKLSFRSIKVEKVELPPLKSRGKKLIMKFDSESMKKHDLSIKFLKLLKNRSWLINFLLSIMIVGAISGLIYTGFILSAKINIFSTYRNISLLISLIIFLILWGKLSVNAALKDEMNSFVISERGRENWKIIKEKDWDKFFRLLNIADKAEEKDKEDRQKTINSKLNLPR